MKLTLITLVISFSTLHSKNAQNYYRYGDISSELSKRAIVDIAKAEMRRLALQKKIPVSWKFLSPSNIEKQYPDSNWIVHVTNSKIKRKKYQNLYINIDALGNIIGASYSALAHTKK